MDTPAVEDPEESVRCRVADLKRTMRLFYVAMIGLAVITADGCAKKEAPVSREPSREESDAAGPASNTGVQQKILSFNLEGLSDKGEKQWEVTGESAEAVTSEEIRMNKVVAKTFGDEAEATLTADKGIYDKTKNNVVLKENVKAVIENTQGFAQGHMDLPGEAVSGVPGDKKGDDGKKANTETVITCENEAVFDYEKNLAYFDKSVKVASSDGNIDADRITVHLDTKTKQVNDIVAEGNVKIARGPNITYSDKAIYNEGEKKVTLTGNPRVVIMQEGDLQEKFLK